MGTLVIFQNIEFDHDSSSLDSANGSKLNVWQIFPFGIKQTISLDEFDASMMCCIRFCHNTEVNHGFACSALGSSVFHLYKNSVG